MDLCIITTVLPGAMASLVSALQFHELLILLLHYHYRLDYYHTIDTAAQEAPTLPFP